MKKTLAVALISLLSTGGIASGREVVDSIIATVGDEVILQSEVLQEIAPIVENIRATASNEAEFNRMVEQRLREALDQAIEGKLLLRQALLAGADIRDEAVEERIDEFRSRFSTNEEFMQQLAAAGETISDLRTRIRKQLLAIAMGMQKRREFERNVEVGEGEVVSFYDEHRDQLAHPERARVRRIFVRAGSGEEARAEAKAKVQSLKERLDSGASFVELARTYSAGPDAEQGGMLGWVVRGDLVEDLDKAAFSLEEGGVSEPIETAFGFVLLQVEERQAPGTPSLDDARAEIAAMLRSEKVDELYRKWIAELRKRSRVRVFI